MSSDNYYSIRLHPDGGYCAVMGFMSDVDDDDEVIVPDATRDHCSFATVDEAIDEALKNPICEYGVSVHPECNGADEARVRAGEWDVLGDMSDYMVVPLRSFERVRANRDEALAQRDAARDIAVRLEGELARAAERASRESIRDVLRANLFDGSDEGLTTMPAKVFLDDASEVIADWLTTDPDAVIAEGES